MRLAYHRRPWLQVACLGLLAAGLPLTAHGASLPPDLALAHVATVTWPVAVRSAFDGHPRLYIVEKTGRIRIFDTRRRLLRPKPFLDLGAEVDTTNHEQGLLGLVFHPDYENNGFFYVFFTWDPAPDPDPAPDRTILRRYQVSADPEVADPLSGVSILELEQPSAIHKGGDLFFGADGYLYLATGDGGPGFDPDENAQNPANLLGKMLRLDVDAPTRGEKRLAGAPRGVETCGLVGNYGIPPDNPYVGDPTVCDEIYFLGLRNPWRWSFDRKSGDIFLGDVGQTLVEEIDHLPAGQAAQANLGWSCREGDQPGVLGHRCRPGALTEPILTHTHVDGFCAIVGGYRYRGSMPSLQGRYFYGDWCTSRIFVAEETAPGAWSSSSWLSIAPAITGFGEDDHGELYLATQAGNVYTFTSVERALWVDGFEAGDVGAWSSAVGF